MIECTGSNVKIEGSGIDMLEDYVKITHSLLSVFNDMTDSPLLLLSYCQSIADASFRGDKKTEAVYIHLVENIIIGGDENETLQ